MTDQLIKRIRVTQDYIVVGEANSSSATYWEKDFREQDRFAIGEAKVQIIEPLRPLTDIELTLLKNKED